MPAARGPMANGGAIEGAERNNRETFSWNPSIVSPDMMINGVKDMADARGRNVVMNDGYATGAVNIHRDSIVGSQFRLNAQPDWRTLGATKEWAEEFQRVMEARFNLYGDSLDCWFDASGELTLTGMVRLAIGGFVMTGEVLATAEWLRSSVRPFSTAIQMVSPIRLGNPDGLPDSKRLRKGIEKDVNGAPIRYWFKVAHPGDYYSDSDDFTYKPVDARKPWGRRMVIHIKDPLQIDQSRGVADMVSVLKQMRMTKQYQDVVLQNAVVQASYAASIESDLPSEMVYGSLGVGQAGFGDTLGLYMKALTEYSGGAKSLQVDGVKIPHLFPGTKMNIKSLASPGGVGSTFEESLLRHVAAGFGVSYEQFSRDYTKTNYSSARASMAETWKGMQSRKKQVADRFASSVYQLWLEEEINNGRDVPLPANWQEGDFYNPLKREALCRCTWIGASRGQIDEMKETQAAVLRIANGLSTYEAECARLGEDWRVIFEQRQREDEAMREMNLTFGMTATKPAANQQAQTITGQGNDNQQDDEQ